MTLDLVDEQALQHGSLKQRIHGLELTVHCSLHSAHRPPILRIVRKNSDVLDLRHAEFTTKLLCIVCCGMLTPIEHHLCDAEARHFVN